MSILVDSHAHLDMCGDPGITVRGAAENGVRRIITVGIDLKSSRLALGFAKKYEGVSAAIGIHPHDAATADDAALNGLAQLAAEPEVVAIGETGLDFYRNKSPRAQQLDSFLRHIELARGAGLPLIVHSREAAGDTLEILEKHAGDLKVVLHCFALTGELEECVRRGYFMSFAGNVTFPNAADLRQAAARVPKNLLLTETDAPYLTPVPHRGKPNRPANIRLIVEELARLRGTGFAELAEQIHSNFLSAFAL